MTQEERGAKCAAFVASYNAQPGVWESWTRKVAESLKERHPVEWATGKRIPFIIRGGELDGLCLELSNGGVSAPDVALVRLTEVVERLTAIQARQQAPRVTELQRDSAGDVVRSVTTTR